MNQNKVTFETSESELEDLIYGLGQVHSKLSVDDRINIEIDFNTGNIKTFIQPRGNYEFEVEF